MLPEIISSEEILTTKLFNVSRSTIQEGDLIYQRDLILHSGSAVIVPVFANKTVALVRQYRHAAQKYLLELPAGAVEKNETPKDCAKREVQEEIGYHAENIELLTEFYVSPGFLNEKMFVFLATELTQVGQNLDEDELLSVERFSFPQIYKMILAGEFEDAKTMLGLILAGIRFGFNFANS